MSPCECISETVADKPRRRASLVDLSTVAFERPEWVKRGWFPAKVATMVSGRGGTGKSSLTLADIAAGSRGELHGRSYGKPVRTILVTVEDSKGMQKARLRAAGADLRYVRLFEVEDADGNPDAIPAIPGDLPELERLAKEFGADMIVVDPLSSMVHGDMNKVETIRKALDPLAKLARSLNAAVVIVHHHKKGGGAGNDLASGSHSIRDAIRSSLLVAHDPESGERVITFDKSNYGPYEGQSYAFELRSVPMLDDDGALVFDEEGTQETVAVAVVTGPSSLSVEAIVNRTPESDGVDAQSSVGEAQDWLEDELTREPGSARKAIVKAAQAVGISEHAIKRAAAKLKVVSKSEGFPRTAHWSLPTVSAPTPASALTVPTVLTVPTAPTGGDLHVYENHPAQSVQLAQSAQSVQPLGSALAGAPTVCEVCGEPSVFRIHPTCEQPALVG
ncbi:AAA family ATPase [Brachybacterium tyrofermentans]|uniref:AAA family ATPase n=1 Tax=Brachybacterium tyrofermentans TaxID=47848 RepID=UPI003FD62BC3